MLALVMAHAYVIQITGQDNGEQQPPVAVDVMAVQGDGEVVEEQDYVGPVTRQAAKVGIVTRVLPLMCRTGC